MLSSYALCVLLITCIASEFSSLDQSSKKAEKATIFKTLEELIKKAETEVVSTLSKEKAHLHIKNTFYKAIQHFKFEEVIHAVKFGIKDHKYCLLCKLAITLIKSSIDVDVLATVVTDVCSLFRILDAKSCHKLIDSHKDNVDYIRKNSNLSSEEMCDILVGLQCFKSYTDNTAWKLDIPNENSDLTWNKPQIRPINILQISDIHIDLKYKAGSGVKCKASVCCREGDKVRFGQTKAGKYGYYKNCDSPPSLIMESLVASIKGHKNIDVILVSGDIVPHDVSITQREDIYEHINISTKVLKSFQRWTLKGKVPKVFPALGNHEAVPVNSYSPISIESKYSMNWLYENVANSWKEFLPKSALQTLKKSGNYRAKIESNLDILTVNSNYCERNNFWLLLQPKDLDDQLSWLIKELSSAEISGTLILISMHHPVDNRDCIQAWSYNFIRIVERFQSIIAGIFVGHRHLDGIRLIQSLNDDKTPIGVEYVCPAVTPFDGSNPAYKVIRTIDGFPQEIETYYLDLEDANRGNPQWKLEYDCREAYHLKDLSLNSWHNFVEQLESNSTEQKLYRKHAFSSSEYGWKRCEKRKECKVNTVKDIKVFNPLFVPLLGNGKF